MALTKYTLNFWSKVQKHKNCCWIWTGAKDKYGYGRFKFKEKKWRTHRVAYYLTYKDPGSLCVLHKCDNPSCVRPDHLFLGTNKDNTQDCIKKGRFNRPTKLTPNQVRSIRELSQRGHLQTEIAIKYKISQSTVCDIINRKRRKLVL